MIPTSPHDAELITYREAMKYAFPRRSVGTRWLCVAVPLVPTLRCENAFFLDFHDKFLYYLTIAFIFTKLKG
jgi:hypothetical protein